MARRCACATWRITSTLLDTRYRGVRLLDISSGGLGGRGLLRVAKLLARLPGCVILRASFLSPSDPLVFQERVLAMVGDAKANGSKLAGLVLSWPLKQHLGVLGDLAQVLAQEHQVSLFWRS